MSEPYSRESGSMFPDKTLSISDFKDIDDSVKDIIKEYYNFMNEGNINSAMALKDSHPELDAYWIDATKINHLKEEIQNIAIYAKLLRTNIISDIEPETFYDTGVLWYKPIRD